jgi:hypothetical protein
MRYNKSYTQPKDRPDGRSAAPRPKRSLGQNFLRDANIARKIVGALRVEPTDKVLEIGPGPGALTVFLREAGPERLVLVEKDRYWARERRMNGRGGGGGALFWGRVWRRPPPPLGGGGGAPPPPAGGTVFQSYAAPSGFILLIRYNK